MSIKQFIKISIFCLFYPSNYFLVWEYRLLRNYPVFFWLSPSDRFHTFLSGSCIVSFFTTVYLVDIQALNLFSFFFFCFFLTCTVPVMLFILLGHMWKFALIPSLLVLSVLFCLIFLLLRAFLKVNFNKYILRIKSNTKKKRNIFFWNLYMPIIQYRWIIFSQYLNSSRIY